MPSWTRSGTPAKTGRKRKSARRSTTTRADGWGGSRDHALFCRIPRVARHSSGNPGAALHNAFSVEIASTAAQLSVPIGPAFGDYEFRAFGADLRYHESGITFA